MAIDMERFGRYSLGTENNSYRRLEGLYPYDYPSYVDIVQSIHETIAGARKEGETLAERLNRPDPPEDDESLLAVV